MRVKVYHEGFRTTTLNMIFSAYGINVTMVAFQMTLLMNTFTYIVMHDERVHPLAKTLPTLVNNNSSRNILMDD